MTDEQRQEWEHLYDTLMDKPRKIFEIFSDYFGEHRVDFQGFYSKDDFCKRKEILDNTVYTDISLLVEENISILIWFPEVKVTNEHDKFIYIQDLYVKVNIDTNGYLIGKFAFNRATYTLNQIKARYMHSHALINVGREDTSATFMIPCTGRGPINSTIAHLNREFDEDLWQLYCSEIDDFTQVESLNGGPYNKLEEVNANTSHGEIPHFDYVSHNSYITYSSLGNPIVTKALILDFTRYLLKSKLLPIEYSNDTYCIGMSPLQATVLISNKFIEWFNLEDNPYRRNTSLDKLLRTKILTEAVIHEGIICPINKVYSEFDHRKYEGAHICTFKGNDIKLHIIINNSSNNNLILLLNQHVINNIVSAICKVINFRYGRKESEKKFKLDRQTLYI